MTTMKLTEFENEVMKWLLAGDEPVIEVLRKQFSVARVKSRETTGDGFDLFFNVPTTAERLQNKIRNVKSDFCFGDVGVEIDQLKAGAGFLLWIEEGAISSLECYTYGEPWPTEINDFSLHYFGGDRKWEELRSAWEMGGCYSPNPDAAGEG